MPLTVWLKTTAPSIVSVKVTAPDAPLAAMPIIVVPLTVAPAAGAVNAAVSVGVGGGGGVVSAVPPFAMVTATAAFAVAPFQVTARVSWRLPSAIVREFQLYQSVVPVVVCEMITWPSTASVNVFDWPHGAVVDRPTVYVPVILVPLVGRLMVAVNPGADDAFATVTVRVAVAVRALESVTVTASVCDPSATVVVFHAKLVAVPV